MIIKEPDISGQIKITNTIYYSLFGGLLLFFIVTLLIVSNTEPRTVADVDKVLTIVVPIFGLLAMLLSRTFYNKKIISSVKESDLQNQISQYRTAKIISWAIVEGACFFALVAAIITSNYLYVAVFVFLFGYFFMIRPSRESLVRDMRLNPKESEKIYKS